MLGISPDLLGTTDPARRRFGVAASARATFAAYTTPDEVDVLLDALDRVPEIFGVSA